MNAAMHFLTFSTVFKALYVVDLQWKTILSTFKDAACTRATFGDSGYIVSLCIHVEPFIRTPYHPPILTRFIMLLVLVLNGPANFDILRTL